MVVVNLERMFGCKTDVLICLMVLAKFNGFESYKHQRKHFI